MPEVRMTLEEYNALLEQAGMGPIRGDPKAIMGPAAVRELAASGIGKKPKRKGKAAKGMGQAMREANKRLRTKSGKLRKGKTQADVARLAHKIRRKKYA